MFNSTRIFERTNANTGMQEWFFTAREGIKGPHHSREQALYELNVFKIAAQRLNLTGGRSDEPAAPAKFSTHRVFMQTNTVTGLPEWFFNAREGIKGPYESKERALYELNLFKNISNKLNLTGGRESPPPAQPGPKNIQRTWHLYSPDRLLQQWNPGKGNIEWFFIAREGLKGPHASKAEAQHELEAFKENARRLGLGSRSRPPAPPPP
ncbi:hypothetical protein MishRS11D_13390 [Methylomagnum ishizawai]|nr:hypothetical protein MishRS11D_13390 [Methylomagnum ishizawai]